MSLNIDEVAVKITGLSRESQVVEPRVVHVKIAEDPERAVRRIRFEFKPSISIADYGSLRFSLRARSADDLQCDLVLGDKGFPEIKIITDEKSLFRFKRGNIKDFFNISKSMTKQIVEIPLRYFIFDHDTTSNVPNEKPMMQSSIQFLIFDFLPHSDRDAHIEFGYPSLSRMEKLESLKKNDIINVEVPSPRHPISPYYSDSGRIPISIVIKSLSDLPDGFAYLSVVVTDVNLKPVSSYVQQASEGTTTHTVILPVRGSYAVRITITDTHGKDWAIWQRQFGFGVSSGHVRSGLMGFSDVRFGREIGQMGGAFQRRIMSPRAFGPAESYGSGWTGNRRQLPSIMPDPKQDFIITLKAMPAWLSSRPDRSDAYRYAPQDWETFGNGIAFLVQEMKQSQLNFLETWNEGSVVHEWGDTMENLIKLHEVTYKVAKRVWPEIVVLGGTTHTFHHDFIAQFLDHGGGNFCDGLAIHGYTYQPANLRRDMMRVRSALDSRGFENKPIYMTEIGFRVPTFSELDQARHLVRATLHANSIRNWAALLWFRLENVSDEWDKEYDQNASTGYAAIGYKKEAVKPMAICYRFLVRFLAAFGTASHSLVDDQDIFSFDGCDDVTVIDGFRLGSNHSTAKIPETSVAFDMFGAELSAGRSAVVSCAYSPIFVVPRAYKSDCTGD